MIFYGYDEDDDDDDNHVNLITLPLLLFSEYSVAKLIFYHTFSFLLTADIPSALICWSIATSPDYYITGKLVRLETKSTSESVN